MPPSAADPSTAGQPRFFFVLACLLACLLVCLLACLLVCTVHSCQGRLLLRGRVPNVTFESYIESRKLSVPRAQPARTASRPARLEAALASPQRSRTKGVRRQPAPPRRLSPICSKAIGPEGAASHKSFASRAFPGRTCLSTASTNQRSAPAAERERKETKGVRRQQKGRKGAERADSERQPKECAEEKRPDGRAVTELQRLKLCPAGASIQR